MATFTWIPAYSSDISNEYAIKSSNFGDGYAQVVGDGINVKREVFSLSFTDRSISEIQAIIDFFDQHAGSSTFDWTPPDELVAKKFRCKSWRKVWVSFESRSLTTTFERVYTP